MSLQQIATHNPFDGMQIGNLTVNTNALDNLDWSGGKGGITETQEQYESRLTKNRS